jgi:arabinofuranosyltransferase
MASNGVDGSPIADQSSPAGPDGSTAAQGINAAKPITARLVVLGIVSVVLVVGWAQFWFLTDDSFIAFRYVSNSRLGYGYVWNPPPFAPVEGYTSFLWLALLDLIWRTTEIAPPDSCNWISLIFAWLTVLLGALMIWRMPLGPRLDSCKPILAALALLGLVTNRTFLAWTSSGLETAMFGFFVTCWIYSCVYLRQGTVRWAFSAAASSALICLTRPDGQLFVVATLVMVVLSAAARESRPRWMLVAAATPLLALPIHLLWRFATYGAWLPNTYVAKFAGAWPASGIRYLLSFVLEYSLWAWLILLASVALARRPRLKPSRRTLPLWVVVLTLLGETAYYTFVIGGDHFEYRVYSHLLLPIFVSFIWLLGRAMATPRKAIAALAAFVVLSYPLAWSHWAYSRELSTRSSTLRMKVPVAPHWPAAFRWYAVWFDGLQEWLIDRLVCVRHQEHKVNLLYLKSLFPSRTEGSEITGDDLPVFAFAAVGLVSWVLPHVNIIDLHGLNDPVIARLPMAPGAERQMAHDRLGPEDYVAGFHPNLILVPGKGLSAVRRAERLTPEQIVAHQRRWMERVGAGRPGR